jgi:uncharacterized phage protein gp47/JayE
MPLDIPERREVVGQLQSYAQAHLPEVDPTITRRRGFIGGLIKSLASALHDWYVTLKRFADYEPWPQRATGDFLLNGWWVPITGLTRNPAAPARGVLVITGTAGTIVPAGTVFAGGRSTYVVDNSQAVVAQSLLITSMSRIGNVVTAYTAADDHKLASGMTVTITGATPSDYNGDKVITVIAPDAFTFEIDGSPASPTGTIKATGNWGNLEVTCSATGLDGNLDAGELLSVSGLAISGLDASAIVTYGGLAGGAAIEDVEDYRARVLEALGTDYGMFSAPEIKIVAKQVPGVTRVWVDEPVVFDPNAPSASDAIYEGQCRISFVRDGDANIFPSSQEVETVKQHILDTLQPAHTAEEDVIVVGAQPNYIDFSFSALSPDTASMRAAIRASLEQFFKELPDNSEISVDAFRCAIRDSWDAERRQGVRSFTLIYPTSPITSAATYLPVLRTITWPT